MARYYETVPVALSISLAARLVGVSRESFRKNYLLPGLVHLTTPLDALLHGLGEGCVWTYELEGALGRGFSVEEVQRADCALDRPRLQQATYRKRQGRKHAA
jgi:hypothetical protein